MTDLQLKDGTFKKEIESKKNEINDEWRVDNTQKTITHYHSVFKFYNPCSMTEGGEWYCNICHQSPPTVVQILADVLGITKFKKTNMHRLSRLLEMYNGIISR